MARPVFGRREGSTARVVPLDGDRRLVEAARRDPAQFDALYRKYLAQVYAFALYELADHHAAEDATERTFLRALAALPRFREQASPEDGPEASTFRVWLFRIARNTVANERRSRRRRPAASLELALGAGLAIPDGSDLEAQAVTRDEAAGALRALQALPGRPAPRADPAVRRGDEHGGDRRRPRAGPRARSASSSIARSGTSRSDSAIPRR